ncbi:50S ribosomal protein L25/general stress protein Ctc [Permianibacter sp. IMCC34836]|uniref:50S ribosomal protein L25/general stress protein Ctc n=1 Tax=Permianibacter fluminis TaxID=2738515 RepID=UPI00155642F0|nr:50S ribosomal protein L25/general stress protein Ctc [Permianibacter fluminis]NQD36943.1 50S ribosomal protein L25/general stress protein Ctc [Permianibacter fluminis]
MAITFELDAQKRDDQGKGASRRLRHADSIPAVIYGAGKPAQSITLNHNKVILALEHEAFYSHILTIKIDGVAEQAILKAVQRHPYKPKVQHLDFLRVNANEKLHTKVAIHFVNEAGSPGVKAGAMIHHDMTEVDIICLPKDLPEFISVDLSTLAVGQIIHLGDLKAPAGVTFTALQHGDNKAVVSCHARKGGAEEEAAPAEGEAPKA